MRRLPLILPLAACERTAAPPPATPTGGPVVRQEDNVLIGMNVFDTGDNGELVDVMMGPGLSVTGAPNDTEARRAIRAFCGNTTPFNPDADTGPMRFDRSTGEFTMPGTC